MFIELISRERLNTFQNLMSHGEDFDAKFGDRVQRAFAIDAIFRDAAIPAMQMNDKSVVFQCISIFDRYTDKLH